jgi:hypothetical protein
MKIIKGNNAGMLEKYKYRGARPCRNLPSRVYHVSILS